MYRLKKDYEHQIEIQKSRFLCYLHKTFDEASAKEFVHHIQKLHPDANHHCYAFIIGEHNEVQRSNDDGEPSGTAGVPMLDCLMKRHMQDITAVVVRYFGGIKLGAGGLIRAYSKSVSEALDGASITQKQKMKSYKCCFSYEFTGKMDYFFRSKGIMILQKEYDEEVCYHFLCEQSMDAEIAEITNGKCIPKFIEEVIIDIDLSTS